MPLDQSTSKKMQEADVLFAKVKVGEEESSATLQFNHALHRINIHLEGTVPDDLKLEVRNCASGIISMTDGTVSLAGSAYSWIIPQRKDVRTFQLLSYHKMLKLISPKRACFV